MVDFFFFSYENKMKIQKNSKQNKNTIPDWMAWNVTAIEFDERIIFCHEYYGNKKKVVLKFLG